MDTDLEKLLSTGCALVVGTVDAGGLPEAARAAGARVVAEDRLRVLVGVEARRSLANLASTGAVALTATDIPTNRSLQLKGRAGSVDAATADDRRCATAYGADLARAVEDADGTPRELVERLRPADVVAFEMTVEERFDQTPGPTAGQSIAQSGT